MLFAAVRLVEDGRLPTSPGDELTGDFGNEHEAISIGDYGSFRLRRLGEARPSGSRHPLSPALLIS